MTQTALIHLNDEAGVDQFSVELESAIGNWLDSFPDMAGAIAFIEKQGLQFDNETGFRDSRMPMERRSQCDPMSPA